MPGSVTKKLSNNTVSKKTGKGDAAVHRRRRLLVNLIGGLLKMWVFVELAARSFGASRVA